MKYEWFDAYCLDKRGAVKDYKEEWGAFRYMVGGRFFVLLGGDKAGRPIASLKAEPALGLMLRDQYPDIVPGYYLNKEHWNSVSMEGDVPDEVLRMMTDESYKLVFASLTKKLQREIEAG
jgi:predicted DNA-binding protein (MmcQ/YjbR family)